MSDTIDDYKALAEFRKQERAERRASAERRLEGLNYSVHNDGAHIVIWEGGAIFDYWPGTDRWRMRDHKGQFGVEKMLAAIHERKLVAMDLSKIEERVMAQMVDAGKLASKPFSGDPKDLRLQYHGERRSQRYGTGMCLQTIPKNDPVHVTTGALFNPSAPAKYPCPNTLRLSNSTPPWQDLPVQMESDEEYVERMERAYPHLKP